MIGQTISRYRLEEKLGEGGMGVVYRAFDPRLSRTVALKTLRPESAADSSLRRRLVTEARAASALNHPAIATLFDFEADGEVAFLVYEYVKGKTLRNLESPLSLNRLLGIAISIADGLAAAHENGIVHRDLKPENVMITNDDRVKILDFGLAKLSVFKDTASTVPTAATAPGLLIGTVAYMSPEQLDGDVVDQRTDIFSFGTMLYELVSGKHPFEGRSPGSTIGNILKEEPPDLFARVAKIPPELDRLIRKCVRKNKEERYQSLREVMVDLESIRRGLTRPSDLAAAGAHSDRGNFNLSPLTARTVFMLIQCLYLVVYGVAISYTGRIGEILEHVYNIPAIDSFAVTLSAMCGIALRVYLLFGVWLNHPAVSNMFRRAFPVIFLIDAIWAASPLLLWDHITWGALIGVVGMAPLPFSQRTLMNVAYPVKES